MQAFRNLSIHIVKFLFKFLQSRLLLLFLSLFLETKDIVFVSWTKLILSGLNHSENEFVGALKTFLRTELRREEAHSTLGFPPLFYCQQFSAFHAIPRCEFLKRDQKHTTLRQCQSSLRGACYTGQLSARQSLRRKSSVKIVPCNISLNDTNKTLRSLFSKRLPHSTEYYRLQ